MECDTMLLSIRGLKIAVYILQTILVLSGTSKNWSQKNDNFAFIIIEPVIVDFEMDFSYFNRLYCLWQIFSLFFFYNAAVDSMT